MDMAMLTAFISYIPSPALSIYGHLKKNGSLSFWNIQKSAPYPTDWWIGDETLKLVRIFFKLHLKVTFIDIDILSVAFTWWWWLFAKCGINFDEGG